MRIQFIASAAVWSAVHCERLESQRRVGETISKNSYDGELGWDFEISHTSPTVFASLLL